MEKIGDIKGELWLFVLQLVFAPLLLVMQLINPTMLT